MYFFHYQKPREKWHLCLITQKHTLSFFLPRILKIEFKMTEKCGQPSFPLPGPNLGFLKVLTQFWIKVLRLTWPLYRNQICNSCSNSTLSIFSTDHHKALLFKWIRAVWERRAWIINVVYFLSNSHRLVPSWSSIYTFMTKDHSLAISI